MVGESHFRHRQKSLAIALRQSLEPAFSVAIEADERTGLAALLVSR